MSWLFNSKYNSWVSVPEQFIMGLDAHGPLENDMLNVRLATLDLVQESWFCSHVEMKKIGKIRFSWKLY